MKSKFYLLIVLGCFCTLSLQAQNVTKPSDPNAACTEAWHQYKKADALWKTGWGLFVPGVALAATGSTVGVISAFGGGANPPGQRDPKIVAASRTGWALCFIGGGMTIASIPCLCVGQARRKAALKSLKNENEISLSLQVNEQGLGFAINY